MWFNFNYVGSIDCCCQLLEFINSFTNHLNGFISIGRSCKVNANYQTV